MDRETKIALAIAGGLAGAGLVLALDPEIWITLLAFLAGYGGR